MAETIACPGCAKRFTLRDELRGKRVKCTGCGNRFDVPAASQATADPKPNPLDALEAAGHSYEVSSAPPPPPPRPTLTTLPPLQSGQRITASREWTPKERHFFRFGFYMMGIGALATVLPFFGYQFRSLARMGAESWKAGVGLVILGALISAAAAGHRALAAAGRRVPVRAILLAVAAVPVAVVLLFLTLALVGRARYGSSSRPNPPPPRFGGPASPGGFPAGRPGGPAGAPGGPTRSALDYNGYVAQFGAERVVRVVVTGAPAVGADPAASRELQTRLREKVRPLLPRTGSRTSTTGSREGTVTLTAAPIEDLEAVANAIDFGKITSVDLDERIVNVILDASQPPAK